MGWQRVGDLGGRQLRRADDDLARIGKRPRFIVDVDADRPAVRAEPQHEADRRVGDDAVCEMLQMVLLGWIAVIADVERGAPTATASGDDQVRKRVANALCAVDVKACEHAEHGSFPLR